MESFKKSLAEMMKNEKFRQAYDDLEPEFALVQSMLDKRLQHNMTQAQLARKMKTKQSAVARLESGYCNPTLSMMKKVAKALNGKLKISIS